MGSLFRRGALLFGVVVATAAVNCDSGTGYVVEREVTQETGSPQGAACTLDSECRSPLRCQGGICSTGACESDRDCREAELCVFGECVPDQDFACTADIHPIMDVSPAEVDFGAVLVGATAQASVRVRNLGSCLLTIQGIGLASTTPADFTCGACAPSNFPRRLPPNQAMDVPLAFSPTAPGARDGILQIRSDDESFPVLQVPLHGRYNGTPRFLVDPEVLDFGFVDWTSPPPGNSLTRKVRLSNVGDGNALLTVTDARLGSAGLPGFTFTPAIASPNATVVLSPTTPGAPDCLTTGGCVDVDVTFTPTSAANFTNELIFTYAPAPEAPAQPYAKVQLKGFATRPPVLQLSQTTVNFGERELASNVDYQIVTITNAGQTDMTVQISVDPLSSTDFSVEAPPPLEIPVAAGDYTRMKIHYDPTVLGDITGKVLVSTNDPVVYNAAYAAGTQVITVRGKGIPSTFNDILKVEMTFANADNGFFGNDYRDVDLHLQSPAGEDCTKPTCQYGQGGTVVPGSCQDPCAMWSTYGTPHWLAIGVTQEPERIILTNAGAASGDYYAEVSYEEDCASIPNGLIAGFLGIGVDALVGYVSGGAIDLGSQDIAAFIANNCWDHEGTTVTVTVYINGTAMEPCSKGLGRKGDYRQVVKVNRSTNGRFTATCL